SRVIARTRIRFMGRQRPVPIRESSRTDEHPWRRARSRDHRDREANQPMADRADGRERSRARPRLRLPAPLRADCRARGPLRRLDPAERRRDDPHRCSSWRAPSRADRPAGWRSMIRTIAQTLDDAAASAGAYTFVDRDGAQHVVPFAVLRDSARALGGALRARGPHRGDCLPLVIPEAAGFLTTFLGASAAGPVPTPLVDPGHAGENVAYLAMIAPLLRAARARAIVTTPSLLPLLARSRESAPTISFVAAWSELRGRALAA